MWTILSQTVSRRGEAGTPTKFVAIAGVGNNKELSKRFVHSFTGHVVKHVNKRLHVKQTLAQVSSFHPLIYCKNNLSSRALDISTKRIPN